MLSHGRYAYSKDIINFVDLIAKPVNHSARAPGDARGGKQHRVTFWNKKKCFEVNYKQRNVGFRNR